MSMTNYITAIVVVISAIFGYLSLGYPLIQEYKQNKPPGVILITGCSSGLGLDASINLAIEGFSVFATVRNEKDQKNLKMEYEKALSQRSKSSETGKSQGELIPIIMDVVNRDQMKQSVKAITEYCERNNLPLIGLVNNAGIGGAEPIGKISTLRKVFEVNVYGMVDLTEEALPLLKKYKGRVVNVGSIAGVFGRVGTLPYSSSKAAVEMVSDVMRVELGEHGISVSLIQPGFVASKMCNRDECIGSPDVTTDAIRDALLSSKPRDRYAVAAVGNGLPAWLATRLNNFLPTRLKDALLLRIHKNKPRVDV